MQNSSSVKKEGEIPRNHPLFFKGTQMVTIHDLKYVLHPEFMGSKGKLKSIYLKNLMRHAAKHCDKLITVSESTRNDLLKVFPHMSGLQERARVVYEAATVSMKTNREMIKKFELERPYFLYLGELRPHKNVSRVIQAFMQFKAQASQGLPGHVYLMADLHAGVPVVHDVRGIYNDDVRDKVLVCSHCRDFGAQAADGQGTGRVCPKLKATMP